MCKFKLTDLIEQDSDNINKAKKNLNEGINKYSFKYLEQFTKDVQDLIDSKNEVNYMKSVFSNYENIILEIKTLEHFLKVHMNVQIIPTNLVDGENKEYRMEINDISIYFLENNKLVNILPKTTFKDFYSNHLSEYSKQLNGISTLDCSLLKISRSSGEMSVKLFSNLINAIIQVSYKYLNTYILLTYGDNEYFKVQKNCVGDLCIYNKENGNYYNVEFSKDKPTTIITRENARYGFNGVPKSHLLHESIKKLLDGIDKYNIENKNILDEIQLIKTVDELILKKNTDIDYLIKDNFEQLRKIFVRNENKNIYQVNDLLKIVVHDNSRIDLYLGDDFKETFVSVNSVKDVIKSLVQRKFI